MNSARLTLAILCVFPISFAFGQSLEELMEIEVTSVSKREEKVSDAAAAIHVLTNEDIRRSGARTIPDALRNVPGVQAARIDASKWAVSIRGFNSRFSQKLLVLVDGRSIYDPLFSGVFWETHDLMMEDVDRIEVIRGPGGTLWGANAVNGVINIITKSAKDTQGALISGGAGSFEQGFVGGRMGWQFGEDIYLRVYGKRFERDSGAAVFGPAVDDWDAWRSGFRLDWEPSFRDTVTIQGDFFNAGITSTQLPPFGVPGVAELTDHYGGNALARWTHTFNESSEVTFQTYYDEFVVNSPLLREERQTWDFEFKHDWLALERHHIVWGVGYRRTSDRLGGSFLIAADPASRTDEIVSAFIQDEFAVIPGKLSFIAGSKFEENDYTGFEFQPNARIKFTPENAGTFWASVSRAVRTPSRLESDLIVRQPISTVDVFNNIVEIFGNPELQSEELIAYEAGWRKQLSENLSLDLTAFYNDYDRLVTIEGILLGNGMRGKTWGIEPAIRWQVANNWRIEASYTWLDMDLSLRPGSIAPPDTSTNTVENNPSHQFSIRSLIDLFDGRVQFDTGVRYVDRIAGVPSYAVADARLGWRPREDLELAVIARSLFDGGEHLEFFDPVSTGVEPDVFAQVTWRF